MKLDPDLKKLDLGKANVVEVEFIVKMQFPPLMKHDRPYVYTVPLGAGRTRPVLSKMEVFSRVCDSSQEFANYWSMQQRLIIQQQRLRLVTFQ